MSKGYSYQGVGFDRAARDEVSAGVRGLPIGVFDSGVGGLTVLRALRRRLSRESFVYLGDTARLPYGTKSRESIARYSLQAASLLVVRGIKCLVVACNTASSVALEVLRDRFAPLPVIGVVEPGAAAGCQASRNGAIAVIATESTVSGQAYQHAIRRIRSEARVTAMACPLFVALAEEGWTEGDIVRAVAHRYLDGMFDRRQPDRPDTLVLGCTHFPVLAAELSRVVGEDVSIVDSAATTAAALQIQLENAGLLVVEPVSSRLQLLATDGRERFARVGSTFLGEQLAAADIEVVDLAAAAV